MKLKVALAGNPNCGKTTLFNQLTGDNQYVGNWPGVTVEKKEGMLKIDNDITVVDLPGIYSLSPYTLEEVVSRNYLLDESPDVIVNLIDGTNMERNLYLTTQILEVGTPVVVAVNMMDIVRNNGDIIDLNELSKEIGVPCLEVNALNGNGVDKLIEEIKNVATKGQSIVHHSYSGPIEHTLAHIEEACIHDLPKNKQRWYAIKLFENDEKIIDKLKQMVSKLSDENLAHIKEDVKDCEEEMGDDAESIITNERYNYVGEIIAKIYKKRVMKSDTLSDKIDKIVTNRILGLPIFAAIMFLVFFISVSTVGTIATDWANNGLFGDGWHLFGIGSSKFNHDLDDYNNSNEIVTSYLQKTNMTELLNDIDEENESRNVETLDKELSALKENIKDNETVSYTTTDDETLEETEETANGIEIKYSIETLKKFNYVAPAGDKYGIWIPGIPTIFKNLLDAINCNIALKSLVIDGIIAGLGAVLGFVPQLLILFFFLAFLEGCGYMARVAFILDRIFRRFGLSGKSFIPILIGTGCGVPGIMASRTIENDHDRKMTIMTTTFIPCSAKTPFIAMIAGSIFAGAWWVAPSSYFLGFLAIICSGVILKKTKLFMGDVSPFVMELPSYHMPTLESIIRSMSERAGSFIKKAGTIILLATILVWCLSRFGFVDGAFRFLEDGEINLSILANVGNVIKYIFAPLGFGTWQASVASFTGLIAKENIVSTMGELYGTKDFYETLANTFTMQSGYSFLAFNLLCAPCFAALGAIRREMNNGKWFFIAVSYQCLFAYFVAFVIFNISNYFALKVFGINTIISIILIIVFLYMLFIYRPKVETKKD